MGTVGTADYFCYKGICVVVFSFGIVSPLSMIDCYGFKLGKSAERPRIFAGEPVGDLWAN